MGYLICFDEEKEYFYSGWSSLKFTSNFNEFIVQKRNERLVDIISNVDKIETELNKILDEIKSTYSPTDCDNFFFSETELVKISSIFENMSYSSNCYANDRKKGLETLISDLTKFIFKAKERIKKYIIAIETNTLTDFDELDVVCTIALNHKKDLPESIHALWDEAPPKNILESEFYTQNFQIFREYIVNNYEHEYRILSNQHMSDYSKRLYEENTSLQSYNRELLFCQKKYPTIYYYEFIEYLKLALSSILYARTMVNAWFEFGYDDIFRSNNFSKEQRLYLQNIYSNPSQNGIEIPAGKILYAIEKDNNIALLNDYAKRQDEESFETVINDILEQKLIFLQGYECESIPELMNVLFYQMINSKHVINKCTNCGKYFIPRSRIDEKYCDRISPQNPEKTCKEYGVQKTYREEIKSFPVKQLHTNISQAYRMRIKRSKNDDEKNRQQKEFDKYKENYQKRKSQYKNGKLSEEKFIEWLKTQ